MACETQLKKKQGRKEMLKARFEILYLNEDGEKTLHIMPKECIARASTFLEKGFWFEADEGWVGIPACRILKIKYWLID